MRVIEAVAAATGRDPLDLETPLYEVVDTDALDRLVDGEAFRGFEFEYDGHAVAVDGDGRIAVDGRTVCEGGD